jgi:L-rhamnose mutarotase
MNRYYLALDLIDDSGLIAEYEDLHKKVSPEIKKSILDAGISQMEIYRIENRLFMVMETNESFSFEKKVAMDASNPKVQEWEQFVWKYQLAIPGGKPGEKWRPMEKIFELVKTT